MSDNSFSKACPTGNIMLSEIDTHIDLYEEERRLNTEKQELEFELEDEPTPERYAEIKDRLEEIDNELASVGAAMDMAAGE